MSGGGGLRIRWAGDRRADCHDQQQTTQLWAKAGGEPRKGGHDVYFLL
jgi:hypothetical protein